MPENNKPSFNLWMELKRRGVIKVLTMYAASAFIVLEAVDIILPRWGLPEWIINLIILLLILGFLVTAILAWIFALTSEGIKRTEAAAEPNNAEASGIPGRRKLRISDYIIAVLFVIIGILVFPKIFNKDPYYGIRDMEGRISVAVMPFENLTGDSTLNWMQKGISSLITNNLGSSPELTVRDDHTMFELFNSQELQAGTGPIPVKAREIAEKADSETYITGSFQGRDGKFILLVNFSRTKNGDIYWSSRFEGDLTSSDYLDLIGSLCTELKNKLEIEAMGTSSEINIMELYPESALAYKHFIHGVNSFMSSDYQSAVESFTRSWEIDSSFIFCSFYTAFAYEKLFQFDKAKEWTKKTYEQKERIPEAYQPWLELWHAAYVSRDDRAMMHACRQLENTGVNSVILWLDLGLTYWDLMGEDLKAARALERVKEISRRRGGEIRIKEYYIYYVRVLHNLGKHNHAKRISKAGLHIFPGNLSIISNLVVSCLSSGKEKESRTYLDLLQSTCEDYGLGEDYVKELTGRIYRDAGMKEEAISIYRDLIDQKPFQVRYWNELGLLLIEDEATLEEGYELIKKTVVLTRGDRMFLWSMGLACKQMENYEEALKYLRQSQELSPLYSPQRQKIITGLEQNISRQNK